MNEARKARLPVGVWVLLAYQGLLFLAGLSYLALLGWVLVVEVPSVAPSELPIAALYLLVLGGGEAALGYASVGMARRRSRGFLVGMACHLLIVILTLPLLVLFGLLGGLYTYLVLRGEDQAWAELAVMGGLLCLPFVLLSGWGFFYLRRFYAREWPEGSAEPSVPAGGNSPMPPGGRIEATEQGRQE